MAVKNPLIDEIPVTQVTPATADATAALRGAQALGETLVNRRRENILRDFRGEIVEIEKQAISEAQQNLTSASDTLSSEDTQLVGDFAARMRRIKKIATQGVGGSGSRTKALIEAERALRDAQSRRPGLASAFRQEAALVLGTDPTGVTLQSLSEMNKLSKQQAASEWEDHVKHGREELGISRTVIPGSPEWFNQFQRLEEQFAFNAQYKNQLEFFRNIGGPTAEVEHILSDENSAYKSIVFTLNQAERRFATLTPEQRNSWRLGEVAIDLGGERPVTFEEFRAGLRTAEGQMIETIGAAPLSTTEARERLTGLASAVSTRINKTIEVLEDPNRDLSTINAINEVDFAQRQRRLPEPAKAAQFKFEVLEPWINVVAGSEFLQTSVVLKNEMIDTMATLGEYMNVTTRNSGRVFDNVIEERAAKKYSDQANAEELAFRDEVSSMINLEKVNPDVSNPQIAENYSKMVVGTAQWLNDHPNPPQELVEQWLEMFHQPHVMQALQNSSSELGDNLANEVSSLYVDHVDKIEGLYDEISETDILPGGSGANLLSAGLAGDRIVLSLDTGGVTVSPNSMRSATNLKKKWEEALTRRLRAQATITQLNNNADEPDYIGAYQLMARDMPFGFIRQP